MALSKLRDSDLPRDATAKALLDGDVYDRDGEKIGTVKDLYVDTEDEEVRFLDVGLEVFCLPCRSTLRLTPQSAASRRDHRPGRRLLGGSRIGSVTGSPLP